jgi:hypothetical protein
MSTEVEPLTEQEVENWRIRLHDAPTGVSQNRDVARLVVGLLEMYRVAQMARERLQVQLAGCATAALGWNTNPAKEGDYGWSVAYQDVLLLRYRHDAMEPFLETVGYIARSYPAGWNNRDVADSELLHALLKLRDAYAVYEQLKDLT